MRGRQVVAFQVVIHVDLPVALDYIIAPEGVPQAIHGAADGGGLLRDRPHHLRQRRRVRVHVDEDISSPDLRPEFRQADRRAIPLGDSFEFGRAMQTAVEAVRPAVIRTLDHRPGALSGAQLRAAMAADVGKRAKEAIGRARH